ncbi:MAG: lysylphosphatidylglycerol synthase transmembrane domain-containing protein [Bacteroidales bacterium]
MKKKIVSAVKYLFFLGIGVFLLYLVFRDIELKSFIEELKGGHYIWIVAALVCALFSHFFRALRWNLMINSLGYKTSSITTFYAVMVGYLANNAIPRMGEVSRCGILTKREKIPFTPLLGSVISERILDTLVLLFLIFVAFAYQVETIGHFMQEVLFQPLFHSLKGKMWILILVSALFVLGFAMLIYVIRKKRDWLVQFKFYVKIEGLLKEVLNGVRTIRKVKNKWLFVLYTIGIWLMYILMIYFPFFVLDATSHLNFGVALTVMVIGSLGIVAPVPGGIGAYHFFVIKLLTMIYAISEEPAVTFATISHAAQTIMIFAVGSISYFLIISGKRKALNNYDNIEESREKDTVMGNLEKKPA